ncbi:MAG: CHASE2 domain-containing protein [Phormidesmis sp.]
MDKWVILELEGDLVLSGFRATLEIRAVKDFQTSQVKGTLPPNPMVASQLHHHWQNVYRPLGIPLRIEGQKIIHKGSINQRFIDCQRSAQVLCDRFQSWLNADSFLPIDRRLREELSRDETIRFLIRTQDFNLQKLPWHEWNFFERYPYAEVALSTPEYGLLPSKPRRGGLHPVRVLAILGHSYGINVEADRQMLDHLPQAQVTFLLEPDRQQLNDCLWATSWDILFFAGHSETHRNQGRIFINRTDSLSVSELRYGLRRAIDQGLQLAIFNSCDGLGLAAELANLCIPQTIVMREPVADQVAETFLKYFLEAFATGESLYLCVRQARERLQGLEDQFPCASWLPVIYQNPSVTPPNWLSLQGQATEALPPSKVASSAQLAPLKRSALSSMPPARPRKNQTLPGWRVLWISVVVTIIIVAVRFFGCLQPLELTAYDYLMRSRPAETIDSRILVIEVTQSDLNKLGGYPLADNILAEAIDKLQALEPSAIALDMHRYRPRGNGRQALLAQFSQHSNLFAVCAFDQVDQDYGPPPEFSDNQLIEQVGFSNLILDLPTRHHNNPSQNIASQAGDVVRRHALSYNPELSATQSLCATPYSLAFQLAYRFLDQAGIEPLTVTGDGYWQLGSTVFQPLTSRFGGYQNLERLNAQLMVNYRMAQPGQKVSLQNVLAGQIETESVRNRIVLMGNTAPVARDVLKTPQGKMAGVWIHAHVLSQLLSTVLDQRPLIRVLPQWRNFQWGETGWIFSWALVGGAAGSLLSLRRVRSRSLAGLLGSLLAFGGLSGVIFSLCSVAIVQGLWLPVVPALLSVLLTGGFVLLREIFKHRL